MIRIKFSDFSLERGPEILYELYILQTIKFAYIKEEIVV